MTACKDALAPRPGGPAISIVPVADSVFEGDMVRLAARVLDEAGVPASSINRYDEALAAPQTLARGLVAEGAAAEP